MGFLLVFLLALIPSKEATSARGAASARGGVRGGASRGAPRAAPRAGTRATPYSRVQVQRGTRWINQQQGSRAGRAAQGRAKGRAPQTNLIRRAVRTELEGYVQPDQRFDYGDDGDGGEEYDGGEEQQDESDKSYSEDYNDYNQYEKYETFTKPKDCGDFAYPDNRRIPCACGDFVVNSTVLRPTDPVVNANCQGSSALIINQDYVTLDCDFNRITGSLSDDKTSHGIYVVDFIEAVVIRRCILQYFINGMVLDGNGVNPQANHQISNNIILDSLDNGLLSGNDFVSYIGNTIERSGGNGMNLRGSTLGRGGNFLLKNKVSASGNYGIVLVGDDNKVYLNQVSCSGTVGLLIRGNYNKISWNLISYSDYEGILVDGDYNVLEWNGVLTPVVVGSHAININGEWNMVAWTESTSFGDNGLVMTGISNRKTRRVVPPPGMRVLRGLNAKCPINDFFDKKEESSDREGYSDYQKKGNDMFNIFQDMLKATPGFPPPFANDHKAGPGMPFQPGIPGPRRLTEEVFLNESLSDVELDKKSTFLGGSSDIFNASTSSP